MERAQEEWGEAAASRGGQGASARAQVSTLPDQRTPCAPTCGDHTPLWLGSVWAGPPLRSKSPWGRQGLRERGRGDSGEALSRPRRTPPVGKESH